MAGSVGSMPCATRTSWDTWKRSQSCGDERPAVAHRSLHKVEKATDLGHGAGPSNQPGGRGQGPTRTGTSRTAATSSWGEYLRVAGFQTMPPRVSGCGLAYIRGTRLYGGLD